MKKPITVLAETSSVEIEDRGLNLHPILDMIVARTGVTLRVRQYCWLMGRLEAWVREFPTFANNEDLIVRAGIRFLKGQDQSE